MVVLQDGRKRQLDPDRQSLRVESNRMAFRGSDHNSNSRPGRTPPEDTYQEAAYLKMLGEKQQPVRIKLTDGDVVSGWIEYYDRRMVRLTREGKPNLFIFKHEIAYIAEDTARQSRPAGGVKNGNAADASE
jgi:host factor-I protein